MSWNKYLTKPELSARNGNLNNLIEPSFQDVNRLFVLAFENNAQRTINRRYYIPNVKIKITILRLMGKTFLINQ